MSLSSVVTGGYGIPGSLSLVTTMGYGLAGVSPIAPTAPKFGGGPFWRRQFCDWSLEDERELERLERTERELEKRVAKAQRQIERTQALESITASEDESIARRIEEQGHRINALVTRLETVQRALKEKEEEREEAELFDCIASILVEEED